jgi:outer membrane protein assembly factor BamB
MGNGRASEIRQAWPGFRGPDRDAIAKDQPPLARSWPAAGPPVLWSIELGEGYASAAVADGCVYVLDYDEQAKADTLRCLSLDDGLEIWRNSYPVMIARNHGMSRTIPVVVDDHVITLGPRCHLACWDARTGECHWLIDLVRDHGVTEPNWYAGQCPMVDEERLIIATGGKALLTAFDYRNGEVLWQSPNPRGWQMTHASVTTMDFGGQRSYVCCGSGGVAAISTTGELLWDTTAWPTTFATCPSPLVLPGGRVFLCSGYGREIGSLMLQVQVADDQMSVDQAFMLKPNEFNSEHHTPILFGNHLYGVHKRGGGQLVCLNENGQELWNSGSDHFGHGPYLIADDLIFVMDDHGVLTVAAATPERYQRLASHEVISDGHDAWGPMAMVEGRLIVRDMTRMVCLDMTSGKTDGE